MMAFEEVKPAFGAVRDTLESYRLNGIIDYGESFQHLTNTCNSLVEQARTCASWMCLHAAANWMEAQQLCFLSRTNAWSHISERLL